MATEEDFEAPAAGSAESTAAWRLSADRRRILWAAAARILPSDDGPGAAETGAAVYVEAALADRWHRHVRPLFERGLDLFQALARGAHGQDFTGCTADQQDATLRVAQDFPNNEARRFFETLIHLVLEGFLCAPSHGGNRGGLGWEYVGFDPADPPSCRPPAPREVE